MNDEFIDEILSKLNLTDYVDLMYILNSEFYENHPELKEYLILMHKEKLIDIYYPENPFYCKLSDIGYERLLSKSRTNIISNKQNHPDQKATNTSVILNWVSKYWWGIVIPVVVAWMCKKLGII